MKVFETLDKQTTYDESKLLKKFKGETFIKSLHVTKKYLYDLILRILRDYHEKNDIEGELAGMLFDARLLEKKGLYAPCGRVLNAIHKKAKRYDLKAVLIDVLQLKIKLSIMLTLKKRQAKVDGLYAELDAVVGAFEVEQLCRKVQDMVFMLARKRGTIRKEEERAYLEKWIAPLLEMEEPDDFWGLSNYHDALGLYYRFLKDGERCLYHWRSVKDLWDGRRHFCSAYPSKYSAYINNFLTGTYQAKEFEAMRNGLVQLEQMIPDSFDTEAEQFWVSRQYGVLYALNAPDFAYGKAQVESVNDHFNTYHSKLIKSRELRLYSNISLLYFINKDYSNALTWNNKILNDPKSEQAEGIRRLCTMMQLPIHYELGNHDMLESLIGSARRNLKRNDELFGLETKVVTLFRQLVECIPGQEDQLFEEFKRKIPRYRDRFDLGEVLGTWLLF